MLMTLPLFRIEYCRHICYSVLLVLTVLSLCTWQMSSGKSLPTIHRWLLVDAKDMVVGRLATRLASILMGKHKPTYSPHLDHGDNVVVVNCKDLKLTGEKYTDKKYLWHTGYPGSQRSLPPKYFAEVKGRPEEVLERAVRGMLPKNRLREVRMARLFASKDSRIKQLEKFPPDLVKMFNLQPKPKFEKVEPTPMIPKKRDDA